MTTLSLSLLGPIAGTVNGRSLALNSSRAYLPTIYCGGGSCTAGDLCRTVLAMVGK